MISTKEKVSDVRDWFRKLKEKEEFVTDKSGCKMLEVVGATFIADEPQVFGTINHDYIKREIEWYKSTSRNVNDIPGGAPSEWIKCATKEGKINSNYGWMIYSKENYSQYENVLKELTTKQDSRRASMIYTRPSMWIDYNVEGMSDFVCTNVVQYFVRDKKLIALVQMRSNDLVFGYKNDFAWQNFVHESLATDIGVEKGKMIWHAGSFHIYERHFNLIK